MDQKIYDDDFDDIYSILSKFYFNRISYAWFVFYNDHHTNDQNSNKDHLSKKSSYN